jgi:hypothetical protein
MHDCCASPSNNIPGSVLAPHYFPELSTSYAIATLQRTSYSIILAKDRKCKRVRLKRKL